MAFKRIESRVEYPTGDVLTNELAGIGFRFASAAPAESPNIEDALIAAAIEGLEKEDYRILSMLTDWFEIHGEWVNVDRLLRALKGVESKRVRAYFAAIGKWLVKDPRYRKVAAIYKGSRLSLGKTTGYSFLVKRNGEDERFSKTCLIVAKGNLRHRLEDILTPSELVRRHRDYFWRVYFGPSYRADMISAVRRDPGASAAEIARRTYGSFQTAWSVKRDISILGSLLGGTNE
jgi:hypothetical protein